MCQRNATKLTATRSTAMRYRRWEPIPVAELSGFTTGAITGIVDRLEKTGYVRRKPHPNDRRSVIVEPQHVKELKQRIATIFQSLDRAMAEVTGGYSSKELAVIAEFFRETTEVLRNETAKLKLQKQR
jgi:DNA-binding MarR family transcriptional regulator